MNEVPLNAYLELCPEYQLVMSVLYDQRQRWSFDLDEIEAITRLSLVDIEEALDWMVHFRLAERVPGRIICVTKGRHKFIRRGRERFRITQRGIEVFLEDVCHPRKGVAQ